MRRATCMRVFAVGLAGLAILVWGPAPARAGENDSPLQAGAWALQFSIGENFTLESFDGSAISIKRHFSPQSAVRAGLSVGLEDQSEERIEGNTYADTTSIDSNERTLWVSGAYMHYTRGRDRVHFVWQLGPQFSFGRYTANPEYARNSTVTEKRWSAGLAGSVGAEWIPTHTFGLHAEYGLAVYYWSRTRASRSETYYSDVDNHGTSVVSRGVRLGLSVYF